MAEHNNGVEKSENNEQSLDQGKLSRLNNWWYEARTAASENRQEQAVDDDFVDGIQWDDEDAQEVRDRHQIPLVFNEIKPMVEWILGTEKRTKIDWKVYPREEDDTESSEIKTKLLKYLHDVNKFEFQRSAAFESAVSSGGPGWLECGIRSDWEDEPLFINLESWRNVWRDHTSVKPDLSDARYLFRSKIIDLDIAQAMFPQFSDALKSAAEALDRLPYITEDDFFDSQLYYNTNQSISVRVGDAIGATQGRREVVRLIECWYREPTSVKVVRGGSWKMNGKEYHAGNKEMKQAVDDGVVSLFDAVRMKMRVAIFIEGGALLQDMPSPYRHNRFPFVPVWAYRRKRDNQPYGPVRNARDPQSDLNKRRSKSLFLLSVNRTIMDSGAVDDMDEYEEESSRPDAIIVKNPGKELTIETNIQLAKEHMLMEQQDSDYIRQGSGVTGENLGMETNATSGKAILARQNQGSVVTSSLFDNLRLATQLVGELMLSLIEQFYTEEKIVRIVGERGAQEFIRINQYNPETGEFLNDITRSQADFKVSEQDYRESLRVAMFEMMMEMVSKLESNLAIQLLDLVFEFYDGPGAQEFVRRIRKINGQSDPNDPEAKIKEEINDRQREAEKQREAELAIREILAKIRNEEAAAEQKEAGAQQTRIDSMIKALEAALTAIQAPEAAIAAQDLLEGAAEAA